jgi:hypothetical protein
VLVTNTVLFVASSVEPPVTEAALKITPFVAVNVSVTVRVFDIVAATVEENVPPVTDKPPAAVIALVPEKVAAPVTNSVLAIVEATVEVKVPPVTDKPPVPAIVAAAVPETESALPEVLAKVAVCPVITAVADPRVPETAILVIVAVVTPVTTPPIAAEDAVIAPALVMPYVCVLPT